MDNKVLDEAVEVLVTRLDLNPDYFGTEEIRESFLAGVKVLLGDPVAWQVRYIDHVEGPSMWSSIEERHVELMRSKQYFEVRPVYAPSLGEGE